jgi:hypothetical protein
MVNPWIARARVVPGVGATRMVARAWEQRDRVSEAFTCEPVGRAGQHERETSFT